MKLVDYLYVDEKRLDAYFEQISSPVTYDKVPVWEASLTITSPGAKGSQQRFARPFTTHEKISKLTEYLEDEGLVGYGRPRGYMKRTSAGYFQIENCRARRVFIPPDHGQPPDVGALNIWISAVPRTEEEIRNALERKRYAQKGSPGNLYLLEDDHRDSDRKVYSAYSSYSALWIMLDGYPGQRGGHRYIDSDVIRAAEPEEPDLDIPEPVRNAVRNAPGGWYFYYFLIDPTKALAQLGAQVGPERSIRTLYRVRVVFPEEELMHGFGHMGLATFGYPIFIAEAMEDA